MKKLISLLFLALLTTVATAQVSKTINVPTAGTLTALLTPTEKTTVTNLTVTGNIDARDVKCMRDEMTMLAVLDISAVNIMAYSGSGGTVTSSVSYPANQMPQHSFHNNTTPTFSKTSLTTIFLPNSITSIGIYAFISCTGLKIINCLNPTPPTVGTYAFDWITPSIVYVPATAVTAYKTALGWSAFTIATEKRVTINNPTAGGLAAALLNAGNGPLSSITHLTVTGNLNSVDIGQMNTNMTILTEIDLSGTAIDNNSLPANAFQNKTTLTSIKLPTSVVSIGINSFYGCYGLLGNIPLPASVNSIGNYAFYNCNGLSGDLIIPNSVTSIGASAFQDCNRLKGNLTLPNALTTISDNAFWDCGFIGTLTIPNSVTLIGSGAFTGCGGFTGSLILPNAIITISPLAFAFCSGFSGVLNIPLSVTSIGTDAFKGCNHLTELTISKNTTTIEDLAFYSCSGLTKISVPRSTPPTIYVNTFGGINRETCSLVVPAGSSATYQAADYWSLFVLITESTVSDTYSITLQTGTGGTIKENNVSLGNGSILTVSTGTTKTFTFTPNAGYEVATLIYGGVDVKAQISNNQYTTPAVNANATLSVTFQKAQYRLSLKSAESGTMNLLCDYGATPSFDFTPSSGWKVNTVIYNGVDVTASLVNGVFTVPAITENGLLNVSFETYSAAPQLINSPVKVYSTQSDIIIEGTTAGETVSLYTVNGVQLQTLKSNGERMVIPAQRDAVYLVKTESKTFKVIL